MEEINLNLVHFFILCGVWCIVWSILVFNILDYFPLINIGNCVDISPALLALAGNVGFMTILIVVTGIPVGLNITMLLVTVFLMVLLVLLFYLFIIIGYM